MNTVSRTDSTETGSSTTTVTGGKITFNDGTVATWTGSKVRKTSITLGPDFRRPLSGEVTTDGSTVVTSSNATVLFSNIISKTISENIACVPPHHGPVSGTVDTMYRTHAITIDFGDGTCSNHTVTVTIDGVTTTKNIGG